jgi:hypothetical protein
MDQKIRTRDIECKDGEDVCVLKSGDNQTGGGNYSDNNSDSLLESLNGLPNSGESIKRKYNKMPRKKRTQSGHKRRSGNIKTQTGGSKKRNKNRQTKTKRNIQCGSGKKIKNAKKSGNKNQSGGSSFKFVKIKGKNVYEKKQIGSGHIKKR